MDQMQIDVEHRGRIYGLRGDFMLLPNFFEQSLGGHGGHLAAKSARQHARSQTCRRLIKYEAAIVTSDGRYEKGLLAGFEPALLVRRLAVEQAEERRLQRFSDRTAFARTDSDAIYRAHRRHFGG